MRDLSSRLDLVQLAEDLEPLSRRAAELGIEWMLFGAQARDLVLELAGLRPLGRATLDVDAAVEVGTWDEYEELCAALVHEEGAVHDPAVAHRLELPSGTVLDLVPFGEIEVDGAIAWPPHGDVVLPVLGLEDACRAASTVQLPGSVPVRIPSLPAYACLKLLAWDSRQAEGIERDAADLAGILSGLDGLVPLDGLYADHLEAMEAHGYDPLHTCAEILGQRMAAELAERSRSAVAGVLATETCPEGRLQLVRQLRLDTRGLSLLTALARGIARVAT